MGEKEKRMQEEVMGAPRKGKEEIVGGWENERPPPQVFVVPLLVLLIFNFFILKG